MNPEAKKRLRILRTGEYTAHVATGVNALFIGSLLFKPEIYPSHFLEGVVAPAIITGLMILMALGAFTREHQKEKLRELGYVPRLFKGYRRITS